MVRRRFLVGLALSLLALGCAKAMPEEATPPGVSFLGPVLLRAEGAYAMVLIHPDGWLRAVISVEQAVKDFPPKDAVDAAEGVDGERMRRTLRAALLKAYGERARPNDGKGLWI